MNGTKICGRQVAVDLALDKKTFAKTEVKGEGEEGRRDGKEAEEGKDADMLDDSTASENEEEREGDDGGEEESENGEGDEEEGEEGKNAEGANAVGEGRVKSKSAGASGGGSQRERAGDLECTVFVRNVPVDASEEVLRERFARFGAVKQCKLVLHSVTK